eukprot:TRINITY_DN26314_c0_g1_i4.p1 TRINITY_DN26314_c0_g1~~TRINITY_DN26314_c0_g1_i4.p1  ORF type:complete len:716 (+),score=68.48 TRINITY_DN26314_c0_g1_i4:82-2148(+)
MQTAGQAGAPRAQDPPGRLQAPSRDGRPCSRASSSVASHPGDAGDIVLTRSHLTGQSMDDPYNDPGLWHDQAPIHLRSEIAASVQADDACQSAWRQKAGNLADRLPSQSEGAGLHILDPSMMSSVDFASFGPPGDMISGVDRDWSSTRRRGRSRPVITPGRVSRAHPGAVVQWTRVPSDPRLRGLDAVVQRIAEYLAGGAGSGTIVMHPVVNTCLGSTSSAPPSSRKRSSPAAAPDAAALAPEEAVVAKGDEVVLVSEPAATSVSARMLVDSWVGRHLRKRGLLGRSAALCILLGSAANAVATHRPTLYRGATGAAAEEFPLPDAALSWVAVGMWYLALFLLAHKQQRGLLVLIRDFFDAWIICGWCTIAFAALLANSWDHHRLVDAAGAGPAAQWTAQQGLLHIALAWGLVSAEALLVMAPSKVLMMVLVVAHQVFLVVYLGRVDAQHSWGNESTCIWGVLCATPRIVWMTAQSHIVIYASKIVVLYIRGRSFGIIKPHFARAAGSSRAKRSSAEHTTGTDAPPLPASAVHAHHRNRPTPPAPTTFNPLVPHRPTSALRGRASSSADVRQPPISSPLLQQVFPAPTTWSGSGSYSHTLHSSGSTRTGTHSRSVIRSPPVVHEQLECRGTGGSASSSIGTSGPGVRSVVSCIDGAAGGPRRRHPPRRRSPRGPVLRRVPRKAVSELNA